nr:LuxR C-terminal-related transcriptional regulator [Streptomyces sp. TLI_146]
MPTWLVPRPRLTARLSRGVLGPLTVVVAPVGAGKSALAMEWAATRRAPGPVAWVACDGSEEQADVFWSRVLTALGEAGVDLPAPANVLRPEPPAPTGSAGSGPLATAAERPLLVAALAAGLAARKDPVVLVLDDFQPDTGSPVARGMASLLRHAAPALRLVVVSRRDPPLHLHRYRLAGELAELRTADLAFDDRETASLLAQHGVAVARPVVSALRTRADGWAAGLRLAAMSMQGHPHPEKFVAQFTGHDEAVVSYLVEEVLDGRPPALRRLLLTTSVLEHLNAELATALAGKEAAAHFAALVGQNSFLQSAGHGWYRCHQMFADVLRVRLRHETPGLVAELHARAAAWLGEHGLLAEAVRHALAAGDCGYANRLVVQQLAIGQVLALTDARLPGDLVRRTPAGELGMPRQFLDPESALVAAAAALHRGERPVCAQALRLADELTGELPRDEADRMIRCRLMHAVVRMAKERCWDPQAARIAAADAEALFAQVPSGLLADRPELKALALLIRGHAELREGSLKAAQALLGAGLKASGAVRNGALRRDCLIELALLEVLRGKFQTADELAGHAGRPPLPPCTPEDPTPAALHLVRAWVAMTRCASVRARGELARTQAALRNAPDPFLAGVGSLVARLVTMAESGTPVSAAPPDWLGDCPDWLAEGLRQPVRQACALSLAAARAHTLRGQCAPGQPGGPDQGPGSRRPPAESLSAREHDVLRRLAQTMTTQEIAAELYLSVNTVKTHLKSVYRKLAVTRRSAAVRRARELELL